MVSSKNNQAVWSILEATSYPQKMEHNTEKHKNI